MYDFPVLYTECLCSWCGIYVRVFVNVHVPSCGVVLRWCIRGNRTYTHAQAHTRNEMSTPAQ